MIAFSFHHSRRLLLHRRRRLHLFDLIGPKFMYSMYSTVSSVLNLSHSHHPCGCTRSPNDHIALAILRLAHQYEAVLEDGCRIPKDEVDGPLDSAVTSGLYPDDEPLPPHSRCHHYGFTYRPVVTAPIPGHDYVWPHQSLHPARGIEIFKCLFELIDSLIQHVHTITQRILLMVTQFSFRKETGHIVPGVLHKLPHMVYRSLKNTMQNAVPLRP
ncbi:hypothetical protein AKJ16_DCAP07533 [Drosera capensis]